MMPFIPICLKTVALYDFIIPIYKLWLITKEHPAKIKLDKNLIIVSN
jgi:hypothetical protein